MHRAKTHLEAVLQNVGLEQFQEDALVGGPRLAKLGEDHFEQQGLAPDALTVTRAI